MRHLSSLCMSVNECQESTNLWPWCMDVAVEHLRNGEQWWVMALDVEGPAAALMRTFHVHALLFAVLADITCIPYRLLWWFVVS